MGNESIKPALVFTHENMYFLLKLEQIKNQLNPLIQYFFH